MEAVEFESLASLLKAPSKAVVVQLCNEVFLYRNTNKFPQTVIQSTMKTLGTDENETSKLLCAMRGLVKKAVFQGSTDPKQIINLFPADFHKNLRDLLAKIIIENLPSWKSRAANSLVSLPRMVDFDWRVDVKMSADSLSRMTVPTCLLQLQVEEPNSTVGNMASLNCINVELPRETLDTMLDGLGKIRDQLSSVATKF